VGVNELNLSIQGTGAINEDLGIIPDVKLIKRKGEKSQQ
jgi:hypothetical protein